jgi:hypothetical protein
MVLSDGVANVLGTSARIAQMYSPTWARACAQRNCVNGSGVRYGVNSKHL